MGRVPRRACVLSFARVTYRVGFDEDYMTGRAGIRRDVENIYMYMRFGWRAWSGFGKVAGEEDDRSGSRELMAPLREHTRLQNADTHWRD